MASAMSALAALDTASVMLALASLATASAVPNDANANIADAVANDANANIADSISNGAIANIVDTKKYNGASPDSCPSEQTYTEALATCDNEVKRICTQAQMLAGARDNTRCWGNERCTSSNMSDATADM